MAYQDGVRNLQRDRSRIRARPRDDVDVGIGRRRADDDRLFAGCQCVAVGADRNRHVAGAAVDVFEVEPLPASHPFRMLDNVLTTPHIGYVSRGLYATFYEDSVANIRKWLDAQTRSTPGE